MTGQSVYAIIRPHREAASESKAGTVKVVRFIYKCDFTKSLPKHAQQVQTKSPKPDVPSMSQFGRQLGFGKRGAVPLSLSRYLLVSFEVLRADGCGLQNVEYALAH
jgi:hypothetical protein